MKRRFLLFQRPSYLQPSMVKETHAQIGLKVEWCFMPVTVGHPKQEKLMSCMSRSMDAR